MRTPEPSQTDWARVDKMAVEDMDFSENPPLDKDFWAEAIRLPDGTATGLACRHDIHSQPDDTSRVILDSNTVR
jgi:hypothetical protein